MELEKRTQLTAELQKLVAEIASDLKRQLDVAGPARTRAEVVYRDERVGYDFDVWLDLLARRAAVLWVLKSVYVRVLEDRGFLTPVRIRDRESQELFEHLTPGLGDTAYLRWVFKDLASDGGLPELFAQQPAEVALPSNDLSQKLLGFWRRADEATQAVRFRFNDEHFDGRLMGDLYQDLDPVVKDRFALLQTPENVVEFVLDETLTPAIAEFGIEVVRVIDPACGSGHFLLAAFKRLVKGMREKFPHRPLHEIVRDVLARVVGIDLNDYACGLARARLAMTALETVGETALSSGAAFHPQIFWADGLEQVERDEQVEMAVVTGDAVRAMLTRPEIRRALRPILKEGFHIVVANPPYITEKDPKQREYHREKIGKKRRYVSASGKYSLGNPFTERMFQLAVPGGFVGDFNANSFMKREFGKSLIEQVLAKQDLYKIIDLGGARFADYGTPTVLLFARRRTPNEPDVLVVMGKKGDPAGTPGLVWASAMAGHGAPGFEDEYVSVARVARDAIGSHPWSIGGGGVAELKEALDAHAAHILTDKVTSLGRTTHTGEDSFFLVPQRVAESIGIGGTRAARLVKGEHIRGWSVASSDVALFPYDQETLAPSPPSSPREIAHFWRYRTTLRNRQDYGERIETRVVGGRRLVWFEHSMFFPDRYRAKLAITFGEVATHNWFALVRTQAIFNQTAPGIFLPAGTPTHGAQALLGILNSSSSCFWMKQVCQNKGAQGVNEGVKAEPWEQFFQFSATKLEKLPLPDRSEHAAPYAERLDALSCDRVADSSGDAIRATAQSGPAALRSALDARRSRDTERLLRMVALQEELDWLCYQLFGVDRDAPTSSVRSPEQVMPFRPGVRPFEITLAREDKERRDAIAADEEPDEAPTAWFERHSWEPAITLDELPEAERNIVEARLARTAASRELALLEQPTYKRRWYKPDYASEEQQALETWLSDRIEDWTKEHREPFTVEEAASALQADPAVLAVAEVLTDRPDFNLVEVVAERVHQDAVPNNKHHVFKPSGLTKRAAWERTWEMQRAEDEAAKRGGTAPVPPVPPKYGKSDYLRDGYWSLRGPLDVPKERFIALTEVPGREGKDVLFAWAGLTHRERAKMLVELDEQAERAGIARTDRIGILHGVWFLADYVAWESEQAARQYRAAVTTVVGQAGITEELLSEWATNHPAPRLRRQRPPRRRNDVEETDDT